MKEEPNMAAWKGLLKLFGKTILTAPPEGSRDDGSGGPAEGTGMMAAGDGTAESTSPGDGDAEKSTSTAVPAADGKAGKSSSMEVAITDGETEKSSSPVWAVAETTTAKKTWKMIPCPRCNSRDTRFCYYNNYNVNQPRHFCRNCQRYWTAGGAMRDVPVGAGRRKTKLCATPATAPPPPVLRFGSDIPPYHRARPPAAAAPTSVYSVAAVAVWGKRSREEEDWMSKPKKDREGGSVESPFSFALVK